MKYSCPASAQGCPDGSECFAYSAVFIWAQEFLPFSPLLAPSPPWERQWVALWGWAAPWDSLTHGTHPHQWHPGPLVGAHGSCPAEPCAQLIQVIANRLYPGFCAFEQLNASGQTCVTECVSSFTETQVCLCLMASGFVELHARNPGKIRVYL